ncbi:MAG: FecR domain-containing protein [Sedimentisphaerales bacterium]|nr:FecR domain-containing protein [Sedimentisphaerales bacterium]MBN2843424.1 FecR domain-containing protein [Sedimentisphaerales bacterium]
MKKDQELMLKVADLTLHAMNGTLTPEQFKEFQELLAQSPSARDCYVEILWTHIGLNSMEGISGLQKFDQGLLNAMLEDESQAPTIELNPQKKADDKVVVIKPTTRSEPEFLRRTRLVIVMALAAVLMIALSPVYMPGMAEKEVATLTDSIDTYWANMNGDIARGTRFTDGRGVWKLQRGMAQIQFDSDVQLVVEAPAEFQILDSDRISLDRGKIYAVVAPKGIGFTVFTDNARIIDLGTEFGVEVSDKRDTLLHVIKGRTVLKTDSNEQIEVSKESAKKIDSNNGKIYDIVCQDDLFVRGIDSERDIIWRQQPGLALADIVAGGDGLGQVGKARVLNPIDAKYRDAADLGLRKPKGTYNLMSDSQFVDGVFVVDPRNSETVVTSSGIKIDTPELEGGITHGIVAFRGKIQETFPTVPNLVINSKNYDKNNVIMIHSNCGITFDLEAIRNNYPEYELAGFRSLACISESLASLTKRKAFVDFILLVDGEVRYQVIGLNAVSDPLDVEVELNQNNRFLTIIVTDCPSLSDSNFPHNCVDNDFFNLVDPELVIRNKSNIIK